MLRSWRPSDRAPFARLNADPEVVRYISDGAPFTRAESDALLDAIEAHWREHGFGLWCAAAREDPDGVPGLRRAGRARRSCPRCCRPSRSAGAWRAPRGGAGWPPRGRARRCATPSGSSASTAVISIIDPANERSIRVAQKLGMRRGADHLHPRTGRRLQRIRDFFARCGIFTRALLTGRRALAYVRSRRGTEPQRARPWGCEARRSEATALLREPTWRRAPRAARDRVAFVKAHLVE